MHTFTTGSFEPPLLPSNRLLNILLLRKHTDAFRDGEFKMDLIYLMQMQPKECNKAGWRRPHPPLTFLHGGAMALVPVVVCV